MSNKEIDFDKTIQLWMEMSVEELGEKELLLLKYELLSRICDISNELIIRTMAEEKPKVTPDLVLHP